MTSSTQHSSPHIRKRRNMDQTTTNLPQMSSKVNRSGRWSKSWEQGALDDPDGSNTESDGQDTPTRMTPGKLWMTYTVTNPFYFFRTNTNVRHLVGLACMTWTGVSSRTGLL